MRSYGQVNVTALTIEGSYVSTNLRDATHADVHLMLAKWLNADWKAIAPDSPVAVQIATADFNPGVGKPLHAFFTMNDTTPLTRLFESDQTMDRAERNLVLLMIDDAKDEPFSFRIQLTHQMLGHGFKASVTQAALRSLVDKGIIEAPGPNTDAYRLVKGASLPATTVAPALTALELIVMKAVRESTSAHMEAHDAVAAVGRSTWRSRDILGALNSLTAIGRLRRVGNTYTTTEN